MAKPGRKPKFTDASQIESLIDEYFKYCEGRPLLDDEGKPVLFKGQPVIIDKHPPTVSGLAYALGFASRVSLLEYQGKKEFCDVITKAKLYIERYTEERLFDKEGNRGAEFSLRCNFKNWKPQQADDEDGAGGVVIVNNIPKP